jgi:hypothetical protein
MMGVPYEKFWNAYWRAQEAVEAMRDHAEQTVQSAEALDEVRLRLASIHLDLKTVAMVRGYSG